MPTSHAAAARPTPPRRGGQCGRVVPLGLFKAGVSGHFEVPFPTFHSRFGHFWYPEFRNRLFTSKVVQTMACQRIQIELQITFSYLSPSYENLCTTSLRVVAS